MRLRICTRLPTQLRTYTKVPDLLRPDQLPGAEPSYTHFAEGWMFSQHISAAGFRIADFHISLREEVMVIPETDCVTVLVACLLAGEANGVLQSMPGRHRFVEQHAYIMQFNPGPGNELALAPGNYRVFVLLFDGNIENSLLRDFPRLQPEYRRAQAVISGGLPYPPVHLGYMELYKINGIFRYSGKPGRFVWFLSGKVHSLLYRLTVRLDEQSSILQKMRQVQDYILSDLQQRPSMAKLIQLVCMNRTSLAREFKQYSGKNLKDYMRHERMTRACMLLAPDGSNLMDVAMTLGYRHNSNFSADFRRWSGRSVTEFLRDPQVVLQ